MKFPREKMKDKILMMMTMMMMMIIMKRKFRNLENLNNDSKRKPKLNKTSYSNNDMQK